MEDAFMELTQDEVEYRPSTMPGPVDYSRLLVAELADNAFAEVSGAIRPDWPAG